MELPPFQACIAAGIDAVMTAHLMLPALDAERPATLSKAVLTGLLRRELGFEGLIVTDALVMEAITRHYGAGEAAVLALEAGADLVLMPADADAAMAAIAVALQAGRLSQDQLEASAARRRAALQRVSPEPLTGLADEPDAALIQELLQRSLEPQGGRLGNTTTAGINLIRLDTTLQAPQAAPQLPALELPLAHGLRPLLLEPRSPTPWSGDPAAPLAMDRLGDGAVLLQLFVRGNPFRGSSAASEPWAQVVLQLQRLGRLAGLIVYGSPYLWEQLRPLLEPQIPAAYSPGQMPQAQLLALGAIGLGHTEAASGFTD